MNELINITSLYQETYSYVDNTTQGLFSIEAMLLILFVLVANKVRIFSNYFYYRAFTNVVGTLFHELAHFAVALCFLKIPKSISIIPNREDKSFGRIMVTFGPLGFFSRSPIALAPILIFPLVVLDDNFISWCFEFLGDSLIGKLLYVYLMVVLITNGIPSNSDLRSGFLSASFVFWAVVLSLIYTNQSQVIQLILQILETAKNLYAWRNL